MNDLLTAIDAYAAKVDVYSQEPGSWGHQLKRHERWIEELASKAGHELKS